VGTSGRFDSLQAAVLLGKWPGFDDEIEARAEIGARYSELLKDHVVTPKIAKGNTHVYAQYTIRVDETKRDGIASSMKERGVLVGIYYPKCFHERPVFKDLGYKYGDFPESEKASQEVLSLPMHPFLKAGEQSVISSTLKEFI
jgi:UDP-2-acetamido-2-deoxy-ribo-hexuluronate aminotransferase